MDATSQSGPVPIKCLCKSLTPPLHTQGCWPEFSQILPR